MHGAFAKLRHKHHREKIQKAIHKAFHAEFCLPILALLMVNLLFANAFKTSLFGYHWNVAMHLAINLDALNHLLAVGFNRRFAPLYMEAKRWMEDAGGFDLLIAEKHRTRKQALMMKETYYDDLIHIIDLLLWMGASSYEVTSMLHEQDEGGRLVHATGTLQFDRRLGMFSMNRQAGKDMERVELHGGGRSFEVRNLEQGTASDREGGEQTLSFGSWDSISKRRGFEGIIDHFIQSLDAPDECLITGERVWETHALIERLTKL